VCKELVTKQDELEISCNKAPRSHANQQEGSSCLKNAVHGIGHAGSINCSSALTHLMPICLFFSRVASVGDFLLAKASK